MRRIITFTLAVGLAMLNYATPAESRPHDFSFIDAGDDAGIFPHVAGIRGHAVAWGDVDGSGYPSLFVGTFHDNKSKPSVFLRNNKGKFTPDKQEHLATSGIASGAFFADFTNTGRLDLYVSTCAQGKEGVRVAPSQFFRNEGEGKFTEISKESGTCPPNYLGRGGALLDFDGDGLLDFVLCEQYYSSKVKTGPALYRNKGKHTFESVSSVVGLPAGFGGLGVAVSDVNNDGWPDIFLTGGSGDNRLYLNNTKGKFIEAKGTRDVFRWKEASNDDTPAGVCIADVNRDGLPDIFIGNHFKTPWTKPAPIRLYLNRGVKDGEVTFEDVSEKVGLTPLGMKAPHVEIQDFDNDGWPDIYVSIVKFKDKTPYPVIFRNEGIKDGLPHFREDAWAVNDFPNAEDKATKASGPLFNRILKDKRIIYMAAGPTCDYDRDGRLDMFLSNWWIEDRSLLLRNTTAGGNWLDVRVTGNKGVNAMGVGSKVNIYPAGKLGQAKELLGSREIAVGYGYCSGQEATAHFGLGKVENVDIEVTLPHGKGTLTQKGVKANQFVTVKP